MQSSRSSENSGFKVSLLVLLGLAAFSSTMKDLNSLREFVGSVREFTGSWSSGDDLLASNQGAPSPVASCPNNKSELAEAWAESNSVEDVELRETMTFDGSEDAGIEPEFGGKAEVAANRVTARDLPRLTNQKPPKSLKGSSFARAKSFRWREIVELKKFEKEVTLDLPMISFSETKADSLNSGPTPGFPSSLLDKLTRRQLDIKTHNGKREFMLRRIDGHINVRRSS